VFNIYPLGWPPEGTLVVIEFEILVLLLEDFVLFAAAEC
jgi:hypothetical protein